MSLLIGNPPFTPINSQPASRSDLRNHCDSLAPWCTMPIMHCKYYNAIADIPASLWNDLFCSDNPFAQHAYLLALEQSGCVSARTGWQPQHLLLMEDGKAVAALPLYIKSHSYGEFVFDWGWAEAYERHGLDYYPKLVSSIPFTPVAGPRLGLARDVKPGEVWPELRDKVMQLAEAGGYSSWHLLFAGASLQQTVVEDQDETAILRREAVQFHWHNHDYCSFDDFLATLRSARRKNLKRERRLIAEQGVSLQRKTGQEISDEEWRGFYQCYINTYRKRSGHDGYLNRRFFDRLRATMTERLMLVIARREGEIVAAALFLFDSNSLYGRYWGALQDISCLHFEACFYQGIEYCIEKGLAVFDPGTQGEHKLMRGFEPFKTVSYHWLADPRFHAAVADFLRLEKRRTDDYKKQAKTYLPYKKN